MVKMRDHAVRADIWLRLFTSHVFLDKLLVLSVTHLQNADSNSVYSS